MDCGYLIPASSGPLESAQNAFQQLCGHRVRPRYPISSEGKPTVFIICSFLGFTYSAAFFVGRNIGREQMRVFYTQKGNAQNG